MNRQWIAFIVGIGMSLIVSGCGQSTSSTSSNVQYREIWIINADGTGNTELIRSSVDLSNPRFSPDGSEIVVDTTYSLSIIGSRSNIYIASANGSTSLDIATSDADELEAEWSPDCTRMAYESDNTIVTLTLATGVTTNIAVGHRPKWSPDGQLIMYEYDGIRVISATGGSSTLIGPNGRQAVWFSSGDAIAYVLPSGSTSSIIVTTYPGNSASVLASGTNPSVATNDTLVAYERDGDIFAIRSGNSETLIVASAKLPLFSPDGTQLAYVYTGGSSEQIGVTSLSATANTQLLCTGTRPNWSPDGTRLVYEKTVLR